MVEYAIRVARATMVLPPRPAARASVAAQIRRARSVKVGAKAVYFFDPDDITLEMIQPAPRT